MGGPLLAAVPVYYVGAFAFSSAAAAYAYINREGLSASIGDAYNYVTGNESELTTLEELGFETDNTASQEGSNYYYTPSDQAYNDATKTDIKANKKYAESVSNHSNVFVGEKTIPVDQPIIKLDTKSFEAPEIKSQLNDVIKLEDQKKVMIKNKEWDKLSLNEKKIYDNQIAVKEQKIANHLQQKTTFPLAQKTSTVEIEEKIPPVIQAKTSSGSLQQKDVPIIETKPVVNAPNVKESKIVNQKAGIGSIAQKEAKSVSVADTAPVEPNSRQPGLFGNTDPVDIVDNKDVSVGETGESDAVEGTKKSQKQKQKQKTVVSTRNIGENILYGLEPSTYEFQLSALTKTQYASGKFNIWSNRRIVIKTSGLPESGPQLAPGSQLNYHVRNVQLSSVIGLNSATTTSNVHNIRFTVFEPFGASLLDDLHDAAVQAGHSNYLRGIYLLKLKFYGMNDEGKPTDSGVEKYFPMKIIQCDFNITGGGTEYNFEAVPYNANTLEDNRAKITQPVNLAGATVGELLFKLQDQLNEQPKIKTNKEGYDLKIVGKPIKYGSTPGVADSQIEGYNIGLYEIPQLETGKVPFSDILLTGAGEESKLAIELFKSTMNHDAFSSSANKVTTELNEEGKLNKEDFESGKVKFNDKFNTRVYTYNAGTPVLSIIQGIIDSSDYIMRQFKTEETMNVDVNAYGEVPWYKIDYKWIDANKSTTPNKFIIRPYWVDQYVALPDSSPLTKLNVKEVAREYDYIYTGKNRDILNFDLQYNFAFYAATAANEDKTPGNTGNKIAQSPIVTKKYGKVNPHVDPVEEDKGLAGIESKITDADTRSETQGGELGSVPGYKTASIIKKQLSDPTADLINLELDILGDPYYLVQEDFNPNVFPRSEVNAYELDDGSIDANNGQVYLKINFKTPTDIDDETGLYAGLQGSGKYDTSFFGGFYRLISVTSNFEEGRFTQQLQMVRCRHQQLEQQRLEIGNTGTTGGPAGSGVIPTSGGEFSTDSKIESSTQTEANIFDGLYVDRIVRNLGHKSSSTDAVNTNATANSGGTANEKADYSNAADNILAKDNDRSHTQTTTVTGLVTGNSFGGKMITSNNELTRMSIGREIGSTVGPAGASVATSTTKIIGNKTITETKELVGNKKVIKKKEEVKVGGETVGIYQTDGYYGADKYGALTREAYYAGFYLTKDGAVYESTALARSRNIQKIKEDGIAEGKSKKEIAKDIGEYKESINPDGEWTTNRDGYEIYDADFDDTKVRRKELERP